MGETDVPMNVTVLLNVQFLHEKTTYQDLTSEAPALFSVSANVVHNNAPIIKACVSVEIPIHAHDDAI